ncbi:hypothetical protein NHQ30_003207 [Ciborinia camelliae]|nr:hypothetical protein NHQ30_003207 [Ciborinia camelliae]
MAISDLLPGVEVTVCVDDIPLVEYENNDIKPEVDESEKKKILSSKTHFKYIEAITDKEFSIKFTVDAAHKPSYARDNLGLIAIVLIDGIRVSKRDSFDTHQWKACVSSLYSVENGEEGFRAFRFSKLAISEDEMALSRAIEDAKRVEGLGEIIVSFHRGIITGNHTIEKPNSSYKSPGMNGITREDLHVKAVTIGQEFQSHGTTSNVLVFSLSPKTVANPTPEILKSFLVIDRTPEQTPEPAESREIRDSIPRKIFDRYDSSSSSATSEPSMDSSTSTPSSCDTDSKAKLEDLPSTPVTPPNTRTYTLRQKRPKHEIEDSEEEPLSSPSKRARARKGKAVCNQSRGKKGLRACLQNKLASDDSNEIS